jgi:hypothetical protein
MQRARIYLFRTHRGLLAKGPNHHRNTFGMELDRAVRLTASDNLPQPGIIARIQIGAINNREACDRFLFSQLL